MESAPSSSSALSSESKAYPPIKPLGEFPLEKAKHKNSGWVDSTRIFGALHQDMSRKQTAAFGKVHEAEWIISGRDEKYRLGQKQGAHIYIKAWQAGTLWSADRIKAEAEASSLRAAKHVTTHTKRAFSVVHDNLEEVASWTQESMERLKSTCVDEIAKLPALTVELIRAEQQSVIESQNEKIEGLEAEISALKQQDQKRQVAFEALQARIAKLEGTRGKKNTRKKGS